MTLPPNLSQHVRSYLTGPEVNLQTVSAKQIRKKLATIFPDLDIKALRSEIDEISIPIFHEIKEKVEAGDVKPSLQEPPLNPSPSVNLPKPQQDIKPPLSFPPLALPPRGTPGVVKAVPSQHDKLFVKKPAQYSPASVTRAGSQSESKLKKRKSKSDEYVNSDGEAGGSSPAKRRSGNVIKKPKAPRAPRAPRDDDAPRPTKGIHVELNCSPALSDLLGVPTVSRPQAVKKLWEYIKSKDLQNPEDKRQIMCDDAMKRVFNVNQVGMFTMNKILGNHLFKPDEVVQPAPPATQ